MSIEYVVTFVVITIVSIILMNLILDNIYGFLCIRQEFHLFLVIYRLYRNFPNKDRHVAHKNFSHG
jgi:hypothetical protein